MKRIVRVASSATAIEIFEILDSRDWSPGILDRSSKTQKAAKELAAIVARYVMDAAIESLQKEGGIRRLSEPGRFRSVVQSLFDPASLLWSERRAQTLAVIRSGHNDARVYENIRSFLLILEETFQLRSQIVSFEWANSLAKDRDIVKVVWEVATSRSIQYRMRSVYLRVRQMLISRGAPENILLLNEELVARDSEQEDTTGNQSS